MKAIKEIKAGEKHMNNMYIGTAVGLILGIVTLIIGAPHFLTLGIIYLIMTLWHKSNSVIKFYDTNIEAKLAPIASKKYIRYTDIETIDSSNKRFVEILYKDSGESKKLRIPVRLLDKTDMDDLIETIKSNNDVNMLTATA
jgi:hypothetical protein